MNPLRIPPIPHNAWSKGPEDSLRIQVYSISEQIQETKVLILSLVFTIIFCYLRT